MRGGELRTKFVLSSMAVCVLLFAGCSLKVDNERSGNSEKVEIQTPVGGLKVHTNINPKDTGLGLYPKARPKEKRHDDDNSANVNISTPFFGLKVIAMEFESDDPPEKVLDFYRKDMGRYGKVIECHGADHQGASGKDGDDHNINFKLECDKEDPGSKSIQLKAGQGNSQRIVGVSPKGNGSEFGLVYIQIRGSERETM
jgi:hypothetical protein